MIGHRYWRDRVSYGSGSISRFGYIIERLGAQRLLLVTGRKSFINSGASEMLRGLGSAVVVRRWCDFDPNTSFVDLEHGLAIARKFQPDLVVGVGGGSAMDMAKLTVAFLKGPHSVEKQIESGAMVNEAGVPLVLVPTTSGSGSEATHFAVVYVGETKYSVAGEALRAHHVILDPALSQSGSPSQKAISGIDAICQSIESLWALNANAQSERYARRALSLMLPAISQFVNGGDRRSASAMSIGSHLSGRAIDISKTTGAHALSYFLTKRFGIPHGNAVALTLPSFIALHDKASRQSRDYQQDHLPKAMGTISRILDPEGVESPEVAFRNVVQEIGLVDRLQELITIHGAIVQQWIASTNVERMANNPVALTKLDIEHLIRQMTS